MKNTIQYFFYLLLFSILLPVSTIRAQQFKVVGYMINWGAGPALIETLDYTKFTHINYSFQNPDAGGNLTASNAGLSSLVTKAHAANVKVLVALGGAGTSYDATLRGRWMNLIAPANRAAFVQKIVAYVNTHNLDGVDIDIEGDGINGDYDGFAIALCDALQPQGKLVTAAVKHDFGNPNFVNACLSRLDFINVMAYDQTGSWNSTPGQHSSFGYATNMFSYWNGRGVPNSKMTFGVPFYGYGWGADYGDDGAWSYAEIIAKYPAAVNNDQAGNVIYYNGIQTIKDKTTYACQNGLGGVMIWELTNDVTGQYSLLKAIRDAMGACGATPSISITSPANNATYTGPANITINANASVSSGSITKVEFFNGSSSLHVDNSSPYSYNWNNVAPGTYTINAVATSSTGSTATASITVRVTGPRGGTAWPIPGKIQAEDYDEGGQGSAYNDVTAGNSGSAYRTEDVDIEPMNGGGYDVGYTAAGEWMKYTVNVANTGLYNVQLNIATTTTGRSFHIEMDGSNVTGAINLPNTGAWGTFQVVSVNNVSLTQGQHIMRVYMDTDGFNLDYVNFVALPSPTITFNNINKTYGNAVFNASATSNSTGAITYSITSGASLATITSGGQVTIKGAGTVTIQASQAAAGGYNSGTASATLTINKAALSIAADNKTKVYNTANPTLTMSYTGFVYSETSAVLSAAPTISTTAITNSNVGTYPISLSGGAAANYNISRTNGTLTVTQATPTISYTGATSNYQGTTINLSATSTSGGTISYSVANGTGAATLSGSTLSLTSAGTVTVTISVAATTNYAATSITQTITINALTSPTITFNNLVKTYGDASFSVTVTSNSTGAIAYSITSGAAFATITSGGQVTITGAGSVTIQASQAASGVYSAGTASATLTINKAALTISAEDKSKVYNTTNPELTVAYSGFVNGENSSALSSIPLISTTAISNSNVGTYPISLSGAAAANYDITLQNGTLTITPATPALSYTAATSGYPGTSINLSASSNSSGVISYSVSNGSGSASVSGTTLNLLQAGTVTLTVMVAATQNYTEASVQQIITIDALNAPLISFADVTATYGDASFNLSASSNSPGAITYSIATGAAYATITPAGLVTITGAGSVTISANQEASGSFSAASATATLTIQKASTTITYTGSLEGNEGDVLTLSATTNSSGTITYEVLSGGSGAASVSGTALSLNAAGVVTIQISVAPDDNHLAQTITQQITIRTVTSLTNSEELATVALNIFPNPIQESAQVYLEIAERSTGSIYLCDVNGKILHTIAEGILEKENTYYVPMAEYASGVYMVKLITESGTLVRKIAK